MCAWRVRCRSDSLELSSVHDKNKIARRARPRLLFCNARQIRTRLFSSGMGRGCRCGGGDGRLQSACAFRTSCLSALSPFWLCARRLLERFHIEEGPSVKTNKDNMATTIDAAV
ncbi:hypothetical protein BCR43DRAFT_210036 [Syncephalastrum racemosum]|uniref:Uncharacterized protein n=1 Tax=Syncephalastrum racemosum TaxID=13706 RepID=A0A1X2HIK2_SYNRA|nr:hypothetical protein BCR43DRAFT_210036 [Syncephalastrum racemosum]